MLKPLEDKIILELPEKQEKTTQFGLIIAGSDEEKPQEAIVVAVGPGVKFADGTFLVPAVDVGDKVVFSKYQGTEIDYENKKYLIIAYRDVFAIVND